MSLSDWNGDDQATCLDCNARVDGPKYGPAVGPLACWDCATGNTPVIPPPKPRRCFCGAELSRFEEGPSCDPCVQKAIRWTARTADEDWRVDDDDATDDAA